MNGPSNPRLAEVWAPYMEWAKRHPQPRFDLCGSNLLPCSVEDLPGAREALEIYGDNDLGYTPLLEDIAAFYGTTSDRVAAAPGTSGANFLVLAALSGPGDEVLIERPAYDPLVGAARLLGAAVTRFERRLEDGFGVDPERLAAAITPKTRIVVITNPHNPSGAVIDDGALGSIAEVAAEHGVHVLVDEVYLDTLVPRPAPAANHSDLFVTTSSLTKSYGLAGLRAGWVLAAPAVAEAVCRARGAVDAVGSFPSEVLAHVAFRNIDALTERARSILEPGLAALTELVESRPELEWVRPAGGTVGFPRLRGREDAGPFVERLLKDFDTSVVPGRFFEAPVHFRVAFGGKRDVLEGGLEQLGRALDTL
jgi:aspartate/methionine/tyrosine aminotransferase